MDYGLEYGTDRLEMHSDAIAKGHRVLVVDDLLATGGTLKACCELLSQAGGKIVGITVLIELMGLKGASGSRAHRAVRTRCLSTDSFGCARRPPTNQSQQTQGWPPEPGC